jgi:hypothetical protein
MLFVIGKHLFYIYVEKYLPFLFTSLSQSQMPGNGFGVGLNFQTKNFLARRLDHHSRDVAPRHSMPF